MRMRREARGIKLDKAQRKAQIIPLRDLKFPFAVLSLTSLSNTLHCFCNIEPSFDPEFVRYFTRVALLHIIVLLPCINFNGINFFCNTITTCLKTYVIVGHGINIFMIKNVSDSNYYFIYFHKHFQGMKPRGVPARLAVFWFIYPFRMQK